jgi:hypothetical protein
MRWGVGSGLGRSGSLPIGRISACWRFFAIVALATAMLLPLPDAAQAQNITSTLSETRSATATVVAPGSGPLASQLQQALAGPNGIAIGNALSQVLGPQTFSRTTTQTVQAYTDFGPDVIPIGAGPGTINCTGTPAPPGGVGVWPVANCNFTGYTTFIVAAGTTNVNVNTHTAFATSISLGAISSGLNWLLGDLHTGFQTTLIDGGFHFLDALLSRGSENGGGFDLFAPSLSFAPDAMAPAPFDDVMAFAAKAPKMPLTATLSNGWRAWIRGSLGRATFDATDANFGFKYRTYSAEGGIERVAGQWMYGVAFGLGQAKVNQDTTGDSGRIDTVRAGAYASYRPGLWWLNAAMAVGFSNIDAVRLSLLPVPASTSYDATTFSAGLEARTRYQLSFATVEPLAGLAYTGLWVDSFRESGTTFLDLAGDRTNINALKGYVGGRAYRTFVGPNGWAWVPEARGRLLYDFLDDPRGFTARFVTDPAATPIPVTGLRPDPFAVMLGGALNVRVAQAWRVFGSYDAELRGDDVAHLVSAGVKGNW